ncbi:MAG: YYY domain-containing protein [Cellvibrionaceae bacterium]
MGGYFRFVGLNWDDFTHLHPDERFLTIVTSKLESESSFLAYIRTSSSTLNPYNKGEGFYVYGNFPMTATFYVSQWADALQPRFCGEAPPSGSSVFCTSNLVGYDGVHLVGRLLSGLVDLLSVLFTFMIGRRLYGKWSGLIAAFFMATAVMAIQQSHFYTMDNWATLFTTISLYFAVRASENSLKIGWWVAMGLFLGLNVASRINVAPVALTAGVAGLVWLGRKYQQSKRLYSVTKFSDYVWSRTGTLDIQAIFIGGMIAALIAMFVFRIAMPYAFTDAQLARDTAFAETGQEPGTFTLLLKSVFGLNPQWLNNMQEIQRLQAPEATFPPALQWVDRPAVIFPLTNMFLYGMGPLAALLSWLGVCFALWRTVNGKREWMVHAIPLFWTLFYFLFISTRWVKSIRYFLPIYPTLFILGGWFTVWAIQRLKIRYEQQAHSKLKNQILLIGFTMVAVLAGITSLLWANGFTNIYRQPMTRVAATNWIYENVPSAISIVYSTDEKTFKTHNLAIRDLELFPDQGSYILPFELPENGQVQGISLNYVTAEEGLTNATVRLSINGTFEEGIEEGINEDRTGAEVPLSGNLSRQRVTVDVPPIQLAGNQLNQLHVASTAKSSIRLETSVISSEHWDDALPVRAHGRDPFSQYYRGLATGPMATTHPDSDQKRLDLFNWIDESDYIILTSQRSVWSLPRLPLTYPMMIHYYSGLFNGDLGFELVQEFHGEMGIGPIDVNDTTGQFGLGQTPVKGWPPPGWAAAEEAFSVYDHPPVWIFRKNDNYEPVVAARYLAEVDLQNVTFQNPLEATQSPNGLYLSAESQASQQAGGSWQEVFNPDGVLSNNSFVAAVVWWLTVVVLGIITFPLSFVVFHGLNDRGYALSRILAVLLLSWLPWLVASWGVLPNSRSTYWLALLLIALVNGWLAHAKLAELKHFFSKKWEHLLRLEVIGLTLYLFMLGVRLLNPDVWHIIWGGEKPMDMSYFTAVMKSTSFPPYDPWHAGGFINYYYYGFVYSGAVAKLLWIVPGVAYNLILPMLFSFTGLGLFSLTHTLVERSPVGRVRFWKGKLSAPMAGGLFAAAVAMILGNLAEVGVLVTAGVNTSRLDPSWPALVRFFDGLIQIASGQVIQMRPDNWFWNATRLIKINEGEVQPITEFPFFTFLYGDLHAHMIALPLSVLALGWAISLVLKPDIKLSGFHWLVGAVAIGVLYPTNSWDYPTYIVIGLLALTYFNLKRDGLTLKTAGRLAVQGALLFVLSRFAFQPFWSNFGTAYGSVKLWQGSYTPVRDFLTIYGLFLIVVVTWLFIDLKSWAIELSTKTLEEGVVWLFPALFAAVALVPVLILGYWWGYELLPIVLVLILFSGLLALRQSISAERRIINVLFASAMGLVLFVEIFVLDGDIGRMNTVFKFYMQVWIMLSLVAGVSLIWLFVYIKENWGDVGRIMWQTGFVLLVAVAALYPLLGTFAKRNVRTSKEVIPLTLDGTKFMEYVTYDDSGQTVDLKPEYEAITWIQNNIPGSPVFAEAHGGNPYRSITNRVAMYTGNPSIIGWDWHQRQQRTTVPHSLVTNRINDVSALYLSNDSDLTMRILNRYNVAYIYHGQLENIYYGEESIAKLDQMVTAGVLEKIYAENGVVIFKVLNIDGVNVN